MQTIKKEARKRAWSGTVEEYYNPFARWTQPSNQEGAIPKAYYSGGSMSKQNMANDHLNHKHRPHGTSQPSSNTGPPNSSHPTTTATNSDDEEEAIGGYGNLPDQQPPSKDTEFKSCETLKSLEETCKGPGQKVKDECVGHHSKSTKRASSKAKHFFYKSMRILALALFIYLFFSGFLLIADPSYSPLPPQVLFPTWVGGFILFQLFVWAVLAHLEKRSLRSIRKDLTHSTGTLMTIAALWTALSTQLRGAPVGADDARFLPLLVTCVAGFRQHRTYEEARYRPGGDQLECCGGRVGLLPTVQPQRSCAE